MAIDFPNSPTLNQVFTSGGKSWTYDGGKWVLTSSSVSASAIPTSVTSFNGALTSSETTVQSALDKLDDHTHTGLTSLGTVTTGTWNANVIAGQYGGTGVANTGKTITLGGNLTTSGAYAVTFTLSNTTSVTLPTSGTLAVTADPTFTGTTTVADLTATGVLRDTVTVNSQSDSYTLVLTDRGKMIECTKSTANNLTIPLNSSVAFPVGSRIDVLQVGAGQVTVVATGGVTVNGTPGLKLRAQWSSATLIKRATNTWVVVGDLSA